MLVHQSSAPLSSNYRIAILLSNFLKELRIGSEVNPQTQVIIKNLVQDKHLHILIADDDADDKELFEEAISEISSHIIVSKAGNGKELMERLAATTLPDMVFLDLNMPAMNGFECLDAIKKNPELKDLPIIIYSTSANPDQIDNTYSKGANLYIQKPSNYPDIKKLLKKLFEINVEQFFIQPSRSDFVVKAC